MNSEKPIIGVITIHDIYNYGSILQAYATLAVLKQFGVRAELINYKYPNDFNIQKKSFGKTAVIRLKSTVNRFLKSLLPGNPYGLYKSRYADFKKRYYDLSRRYNTHDQLKASPPEYDLYMTGSDQLWRPKFTRGDSNFFLQFSDESKPRIAYSSSFGCLNLDPEYEDMYRCYLNSFKAIAVREQAGVEIVEKLTGKQAELVLDPTLLLTHEEWMKVACPYWKTELERDYIVCYGFNPNSNYMLKLASYLSEEFDMDIVHVGGKFYNYFSSGIKYLLDVGPGEWLDVLNRSSFILAQSFHGTAYAITFEKPFLSLLRGDENHDSRQKQLLNSIGLESRMVYPGTDYSVVKKGMLDIDFTSAQQHLTDLRGKSFNFLKTNILGSVNV